MLQVEGVSTYYGGIQALKEASITVREGEIVVIVGTNGAGKTTLLRTISGVLKARKGRILFRGQEITNLRPPTIVGLGICHVPEGRHVFPTLSVQDNLLMGAYLRVRRGKQREIEKDYDYVFDLFPILKKRRRQRAGTLSGGEQQMLAIGRALMSRPHLLLLDEPSMGLAPLVIHHVFEALTSLIQRGLTLLMVEQNAEIALSIANRAYVLQTGEVALSGTAQDLRQDPRLQDLYLGNTRSAGVGDPSRMS